MLNRGLLEGDFCYINLNFSSREMNRGTLGDALSIYINLCLFKIEHQITSSLHKLYVQCLVFPLLKLVHNQYM